MYTCTEVRISVGITVRANKYEHKHSHIHYDSCSQTVGRGPPQWAVAVLQRGLGPG